ncbi:MAG: UbiD family decarboxylase, partial [Desulfatiglandales bacterium]|nr:UbiD family decarboxylase [Desulfatiglandales bacterium]
MLTVIFTVQSFGAEKVQMTGPYDSVRDYIAAMEARGRVLRIKEVDQDNYEATAFMYRMFEKMGHDVAPAVVFERVKINGEWMDGPVLGNIYTGWDAAAMIFGVEKVTDDPGEMYRAVVKKIESSTGSDDKWKRIKQSVVEKKKAPCKEVVMLGDDVDLYKFPWFKTNPGDASQYISAGAVIMEDPELGRNVGTYRCQVKEKNKIGINANYGQHGFIFIMKAKRRGEKVMKAAVAVGVDPIVWSMSSTKLADLGDDEISLAGGFMNKPVTMVKCETSDIMVPANAEMIIEGEIPFDMEDEGPYGEMLGYLGRKHKIFYMNVKAVTHRKNPWIINSFTGAIRPTHMIPWSVGAYVKLKKL